MLKVLGFYGERLKNKNLIETTKAKRLEEIREFEKSIDDKSVDIKTQIKTEQENLGFEFTRIPNLPDNVYMVTGINDKYTTRLRLYKLKDGIVEEMKCNKTDMKTNPAFGEYSIIRMLGYKEKNKRQQVGEQWIETGEKDKFLSSWTIIK